VKTGTRKYSMAVPNEIKIEGPGGKCIIVTKNKKKKKCRTNGEKLFQPVITIIKVKKIKLPATCRK
jgi:hypothetical protein